MLNNKLIKFTFFMIMTIKKKYLKKMKKKCFNIENETVLHIKTQNFMYLYIKKKSKIK